MLNTLHRMEYLWKLSNDCTCSVSMQLHHSNDWTWKQEPQNKSNTTKRYGSAEHHKLAVRALESLDSASQASAIAAAAQVFNSRCQKSCSKLWKLDTASLLFACSQWATACRNNNKHFARLLESKHLRDCTAGHLVINYTHRPRQIQYNDLARQGTGSRVTVLAKYRLLQNVPTMPSRARIWTAPESKKKLDCSFSMIPEVLMAKRKIAL